MIKKILITGSSGQVGSQLVEYFMDKYEVAGLDIKKSGIKVVDDVTKLCDIRDKKAVNPTNVMGATKLLADRETCFYNV